MLRLFDTNVQACEVILCGKEGLDCLSQEIHASTSS